MNVGKAVNEILGANLRYSLRDEVFFCEIAEYHKTAARDWVVLKDGTERDCDFRECDNEPNPGCYWYESDGDYGFFSAENFSTFFEVAS